MKDGEKLRNRIFHDENCEQFRNDEIGMLKSEIKVKMSIGTVDMAITDDEMEPRKFSNLMTPEQRKS